MLKGIQTRLKQCGQGMTEYIIIVALIAIAAIAIYSLFGDTIRQQMGIMTEELAGTDSAISTDATAAAAKTEGETARGLKDFSDSSQNK